jgi:phenylpropionate dioxygenase-like ring-hydroxylating dioxygenase large terminal subunit
LLRKLFEKNRLIAFDPYVGKHQVVPHPWRGYYLERDKDAKIVARENACLHRGYQLVNKRTSINPGQRVVCEFHNWGYDKGELVSAPGFSTPIDELPCRRLRDIKLTDICGFFFEDLPQHATDSISEMFAHPNLQEIWFPEYKFAYETKKAYPVAYSEFLEIYLDGYHVTACHPGLGGYLEADDMEWHTGSEFSLQINKLCKADIPIESKSWARFRKLVENTGWDRQWGAMFGTIYPGLMLEFYPHIVCVSQIVPNEDNTLVHNYVQMYSTFSWDSEYLKVFRKAYKETAREDAVLQNRLRDGRVNRGGSLGLVNHDKLEKGLPLLEKWIKENS